MKSILKTFLLFCLTNLISKNIQSQELSDSAKNNLNSQYEGLLNRLYKNNAAKNFDSALLIIASIEKYVVDIFGPESQKLANVYSSLYPIIYVQKLDYLACYKSRKKAQAILTKYQDTVSVDYLGNAFELAKTCLLLGPDYSEEASTLFNEIKKPLKTAQDQGAYAQFLLIMGGFESERGVYNKAQSLYEESLKILDSLPETEGTCYLKASIFNNMAIGYSSLGSAELSLKYMLKAKEIALKNIDADQETLVPITLGLANLLTQKGAFKSAWEEITTASDLVKRNYYFQFNGPLKSTKAAWYLAQQNFSSATSELDAYFKERNKFLPMSDGDEKTMVLYAALLNITGNLAKSDSIGYLQLKRIYATGKKDDLVGTQLRLTLFGNLWQNKQYSSAADSLYTLLQDIYKVRNRNLFGLTEQQQLACVSNFNQALNLYYECLQAEPKLLTKNVARLLNLELQRKSLVQNNWANVLKRLRNSTDSIEQQRFKHWTILRQQLANKQEKSNNDSLQQAYDKAEQALAQIAGPLTIPNTEWQQIVNKQSNGEVNIEFVRYLRFDNSGNEKAFYSAFVFKKVDTMPHLIPLCSEVALEKLMKTKNGNWMDAIPLTQILYEKNTPTAQQLYRFLWKPLEPFLIGAKTIHYTKAGLLNNISFAAICAGPLHLGQRYTLHYRQNLSAEIASTMPVPNQVDIWGNIDYDDSDSVALDPIESAIDSSTFVSANQLNNLKRTTLRGFGKTEVDVLPAIFSAENRHVTTYSRHLANEAIFKESAPKTKGLFHISTHGFYLNDSSRKVDGSMLQDLLGTAQRNPLLDCGVAMAGINYKWITGNTPENAEDGLLTGYEVAQLDLSKIDLVTLSACETGLGQTSANEGNMGLVRAFKLAGAKKVLASLWPVPAKQTAELMTVFYKNWLQNANPAIALKNAQLQLLAKGYAPFFWAGFVLVE